LGGPLFGHDTGVISGAVLFIRKVMDLPPTTEGSSSRPRGNCRAASGAAP
jgi:hypothetical protein